MRYPLKLSILEASVDWKRDGAGRMLAYINLSRCIEAIHPRPPPPYHWEEEELLGISHFPFSWVEGRRRRRSSALTSSIRRERTSQQDTVPLLTMIQADLGPLRARPPFLSIRFVRLLFMGETTRGSDSTIDFSNVSGEKIPFTFGHRSYGTFEQRSKGSRGRKVMCVTVFRVTNIFLFELSFSIYII